jgi:CubicO group peptidase (beta-lactamase class C family)
VGGRRHLCVAVLVLALLPAAACGHQRDTAPSRVDSSGLTKRIEQQLAMSPAGERLRAVVVLHRGQVVYEHYQQAHPDDHWNIDAATTTVLSTLVGIALHEGRIPGLGATLAQLLPDRASSMSPQVAHTNLQQLLTMTAGFDVPDNNRADLFVQHADPVGTILRSQANPPGRFFDYSDQGAHLLSAILEHATGMSVLAYARLRLLDPLGIPSRPADEPLGSTRALAQGDPRHFGWAVDRAGLQDGWNGLRLRPRDLARIGQVFLDDGRWRGRQVVPQNWTQVATLTHVATSYELAPGYGYGWWVDERNAHTAYFAWGYGGQLLEVLPKDQIVAVVVTAQDPTNLVRGFFAAELTSLVDHVIVPAVTQPGA